MKLCGKEIGKDKPTYIIAEIGINHNGDFDTAKCLIDKAKECGVDCVKFQKRHLPSIYKPEVLANPHIHSIGLSVYIPVLKQMEFTIEQHFELKEYCKDINIDYLCTPFDIVSAKELESINVAFYKIGSINMANMPLLDYIANTNKPLLVSTGMHTYNDIERIDMYLWNKKIDYAFMHCVSTYPVDFKDVNLNAMLALKELHEPVGYSGHERGIEISVCAVAIGASIIERHFTLDRTQKGLDHACSLEPEGLRRMCEHIRMLELARGDGVKKITRGEQIVRESLGGEALCIGDSKAVSMT